MWCVYHIKSHVIKLDCSSNRDETTNDDVSCIVRVPTNYWSYVHSRLMLEFQFVVPVRISSCHARRDLYILRDLYECENMINEDCNFHRGISHVIYAASYLSLMRRLWRFRFYHSIYTSWCGFFGEKRNIFIFILYDLIISSSDIFNISRSSFILSRSLFFTFWLTTHTRHCQTTYFFHHFSLCASVSDFKQTW